MMGTEETGVNLPLKGLRVLVIDVDPAVRNDMDAAFTGAGATVSGAPSGQAGLQALKQGEYDVLMVGAGFRGPARSACIEAALKIRPALAVVVISDGDGGTTDTERLAGLARVCPGPVDPAALVAEIRAEYAARRAAAEQWDDAVPEQEHSEWSLLRRLTETVIPTESLVDALYSLCSGLGGLLHSSAVAVLDVDEDVRVLIIAVQEAVSRGFIDAVRAEVFQRYQALTGEELDPGSVRTHVKGRTCSPEGEQAPNSLLSVPIVTQREIRGILILATSTTDAYTKADTSFLSHAADYLSTVFVALRRMHHLAIHDGLTGLFSRLYGEEMLKNSLSRAERYKLSVSVAILDIDRFKDVNDNWGHLVGDQVLREFARLLRQTVRDADVVVRYGGEEFLIILPQTKPESAVAFTERLLQKVRDHTFCDDVHPLRLTVSIGVAGTDDAAAGIRDSDELLDRADQALYLAKHNGRSRVCPWRDVERRNVAGAADAAGDAAALDLIFSKPGRVLVVDDDGTICTLLQRLLDLVGYQVDVAASAVEAFARVDGGEQSYDIVLTDIHMPGMTGIELLERLHESDESILVIVMTGYATVDVAIDSLRHGAYDFIQKPIAPQQLKAVIKRALAYRRALIENRTYQLHLEDLVRLKSAELTKSLEEIKRSYQFTLEAFAEMIDARERDCYQHSLRVRDASLILGRTMGLAEEELKVLDQGALLHDIGKIGVPDAVLLKPDRLTEEERRTMRQHCEIGYNIIHSGSWLKGAAEIVYSHHESYDGTGYPRGLKGTEICLGARIFTVVDAYDAMRSVRVYSAAATPAAAVDEIRGNSGRQFDPDVVAAFVKCLREIEQIYSGSGGGG